MITKTLREWRDEYEKKGVYLLDPDGFNRSNPNMWETQLTQEEFIKGLMKSTISMAEEAMKEFG